jgi:hypothetical protein
MASNATNPNSGCMARFVRLHLPSVGQLAEFLVTEVGLSLLGAPHLVHLTIGGALHFCSIWGSSSSKVAEKQPRECRYQGLRYPTMQEKQTPQRTSRLTILPGQVAHIPAGRSSVRLAPRVRHI